MEDIGERIRRYYDALADGEWDRLFSSFRGRVSFEVHSRLLGEFVRAGDRVLEIGAGGGRFTIVLAQLGAKVVVTDISEVQLGLNRTHAQEAGVESAVQDRFILDVRDTSRFAPREFDAVVAFGGPLSYAFEAVEDALSGLLRVGDVVLASVMSTLGSWRFFLPEVIDEAAVIGQDANDALIRTGNLRHSGPDARHVCRMFRSSELTELVSACGAEILAISASNFASMTDEATLARIAADADHWSRFMAHEMLACRQPGALDGGSHILFAARQMLDQGYS